MKVTGIQVGELGTNCYIYRDESTGRCAIIDPGDVDERLRAAIEEAMSGRNRNKVYASAEEMMKDILND